jgi:hypothetical protein
MVGSSELTAAGELPKSLPNMRGKGERVGSGRWVGVGGCRTRALTAPDVLISHDATRTAGTAEAHYIQVSKRVEEAKAKKEGLEEGHESRGGS